MTYGTKSETFSHSMSRIKQKLLIFNNFTTERCKGREMSVGSGPDWHVQKERKFGCCQSQSIVSKCDAQTAELDQAEYSRLQLYKKCLSYLCMTAQ